MPRRLAVIAHDNKKVDLIATRHTARLVRDKVGLEVEELLSGPEGGDAQIAARVATADLIIAALAAHAQGPQAAESGAGW
jgi:methylglyoxal synthase